MKILKFRDACKLAFSLKPYVPKETINTGFDFVGKIVDNIVNDSKHEIFIESLMILSGAEESDLLTLEPKDAVYMFIEGLVNNKILSLVEFCDKVQNG